MVSQRAPCTRFQVGRCWARHQSLKTVLQPCQAIVLMQPPPPTNPPTHPQTTDQDPHAPFAQLRPLILVAPLAVRPQVADIVGRAVAHKAAEVALHLAARVDKLEVWVDVRLAARAAHRPALAKVHHLSRAGSLNQEGGWGGGIECKGKQVGVGGGVQKNVRECGAGGKPLPGRAEWNSMRLASGQATPRLQAAAAAALLQTIRLQAAGPATARRNSRRPPRTTHLNGVIARVRQRQRVDENHKWQAAVLQQVGGLQAQATNRPGLCARGHCSPAAAPMNRS